MRDGAKRNVGRPLSTRPSMTTPRWRAELTTPTVDAKTFTSRALSLSTLRQESRRRTSVLLGGRRSRLALIHASTSSTQHQNTDQRRDGRRLMRRHTVLAIHFCNRQYTGRASDQKCSRAPKSPTSGGRSEPLNIGVKTTLKSKHRVDFPINILNISNNCSISSFL